MDPASDEIVWEVQTPKLPLTSSDAGPTDPEFILPEVDLPPEASSASDAFSGPGTSTDLLDAVGAERIYLMTCKCALVHYPLRDLKLPSQPGWTSLAYGGKKGDSRNRLIPLESGGAFSRCILEPGTTSLPAPALG